MVHLPGMEFPLQKRLYFICILYLFYRYFNFVEFYFIAIFFDKGNRPSSLLLFYFYLNPILQYQTALK